MQSKESSKQKQYTQELATQIDHPRAMRAVGSSCGINPYPLIIPCHRVIHSSGKIGGYALDLRIKETLLKHEKKRSSSRVLLETAYC